MFRETLGIILSLVCFDVIATNTINSTSVTIPLLKDRIISPSQSITIAPKANQLENDIYYDLKCKLRDSTDVNNKPYILVTYEGTSKVSSMNGYISFTNYTEGARFRLFKELDNILRVSPINFKHDNLDVTIKNIDKSDSITVEYCNAIISNY